MRKLYLFAILLFCSLASFAQIQVTDFDGVTTNTDTMAARLARKIVGKGMTVVNCRTGIPTQWDYPKFSGTPFSAGFFKNAKNVIGIDSGIILTNGRAKTSSAGTGINGPNSIGASTTLGGTGNIWLTSYLQTLPNSSTKVTTDVSVLQFSFIPEGNTLAINYVFGSQEYEGFTCSNYTDMFAFMMVSGPGVPAAPQDKNIALVPGTSIPVSINTVNRGGPINANCPSASGIYTQYYVDNSPSISSFPPASTYLTYKGYTKVLTAYYTNLTPCAKYNILLGVADVTDGILDSGVFIEANSFSAPEFTLKADNGFRNQDSTTVAIEGCKKARIKIKLKDTAPKGLTLYLKYTGTAVNGVDYQPIDSVINFNAGEIEKFIDVIPILDNLTEGRETVIVQKKGSTCVIPCGLPPAADTNRIVIYIQDTILFHHKDTISTCNFPVQLKGPTDTLGLANNEYTWNVNLPPPHNGKDTTVNAADLYWVKHHFSDGPLTNFAGCYNIDSFLVRQGGPDFTLGPDRKLCKDSTIKIGYHHLKAKNYLWSTGATTDSISVSTLGTYWLKIIDSSGCDRSDTINIISGEPVFTLPDTVSVCNGGSATLGLTTSSPGQTYLWNTGATTSTISTSTIGQYILTVKENGCFASDTSYVKIGGPVFSLGNDTTLCTDSTRVIGTSVTADQYEWKRLSNATVIGTSQYLTINSVGTYILKLTSNGCSSSDTIVISNGDPAAFTLGADRYICIDSTRILTPSPAIAVPVAYTWALDGAVQSATTAQYTATQKGQYVLTVTNLYGCPRKDTVNIIQGDPPAFSIGKDTTICTDSTRIIGIAAIPGATYNWLPGGQTTRQITINGPNQYILNVVTNGCPRSDTINIASGDPIFNLGADILLCKDSTKTIGITPITGATYAWNPGTTITTPTRTVNATGQYILSVKKDGCVGKDTILVTSGDPQPFTLGGNLPICTDSTKIIKPTPAVSGNYQWNGTATQTGSQISVTAPGKYWLTVTENGCPRTDTATVFNSDPTPFSLGSDIPLCTGSSTQIGVTTNSGLSYVWNTGATTSKITVNSFGTYWLKVLRNNCPASDTINIISGDPVFSLGADTFFCAGQSIQIGTSVAAASYKWKRNTTNLPQTTSYITVNTAGTYILTLSGVGGCSKSDTIEVADGTPIISLSQSTVSFCDKDSIQVTASVAAPNNGGSFSWEPAGVTTPSVYIKTPGKHTIKYLAPNGCTNSRDVTAFVKPLPYPKLRKDTFLCSTDTLKIGTTTYVGATYQWNNGSTNTYIIARDSGWYSVTNTLNGCIAKDSVRINRGRMPVAFAGLDQTIFEGTYLQLFATTGPNNKTYSWSPKLFLSDTTIYNPVATPLITTPFYLKVVSPDKCEAFDTVLITVKPFRLDIPNSFSPNGDGINDTWNLGELGLSSQARVTIYDRGGGEVFNSNGYNVKWDGTRNGKPVPAGTYYYIIEPGFKFARRTGWVLLIR